MDSGESLSSSFEEKDSEKERTMKNYKSVDIKNARQCGLEHELKAKAKNCKPSMIPLMKNEKTETKTFASPKCRPPSSSKSLKADRQKANLDCKLKALNEKEKSIAEYYLKIEELIQRYMNQKQDDRHNKLINPKSEDSRAKKMTSDPSVISKCRIKNEISEFEKNIQQISNIWLKTTSDLSSMLKNLKNNSRVDPIEVQMENIRIQLAIKQAKSLTLVKTRSVIAEAKKLFRNREIIRSELECLLNYENLKTETNSQKVLKEIEKSLNQKNLEEQGMDGTGDSLKDSDSSNLENNKDGVSDKCFKERLEEECSTKYIEDNFWEGEDCNAVELEMKCNSAYNPSKIIADMENLKKELIKKNNTITNLNKKIFDLQKTCNENSTKYNQLQVKLLEFHEKIQWNQVLWKQIGKLKERIKGLQQNNKELDFQKKDLESKIIRREQEIDRLLKLNNVLNKKRHLLNAQEITITECKGGEHKQSRGETLHDKYVKKLENNVCFDENVISGKQTAINQLKKILNVMKDQENFAQNQISMFQSRIEELEKDRKV